MIPIYVEKGIGYLWNSERKLQKNWPTSLIKIYKIPNKII